MKPGDMVRICEQHRPYPYPHKPDDPWGKLGVILEELIRPAGGPSRFKVLVSDSIHTFFIHSLEQQ